MPARPRGVLLDLGGVVYVGAEPLPGALAAIGRLKAAGLGVRCITNTTSQPHAAMLARLGGYGIRLTADELFMPAIAARRFLQERALCPFLLVAPPLEVDFAGLPGRAASGISGAVVVGDAGPGFTYEAMTRAFRLLNDGAAFLALARNRSFQDADGRLSLDAGPFVAALEYATRREATLFGKPSADFFGAAVASLGCRPEDVVMIGDDAEMDIAGAVGAGLRGLLVRSGKYRPGDEAIVERALDSGAVEVVDDLAAAVDRILMH